MLSEHSIVAFTASSSRAQAKQFYGDTLGLKLLEDSEFALAYDANGTMLRVQIVQDVSPRHYTVLGWKVGNVAVEVRRLMCAGVVFQRFGFEQMEQDELGIWDAPSGARVAWFKDPDGNIFSLTQFPEPPSGAP